MKKQPRSGASEEQDEVVRIRLNRRGSDLVGSIGHQDVETIYDGADIMVVGSSGNRATLILRRSPAAVTSPAERQRSVGPTELK